MTKSTVAVMTRIQLIEAPYLEEYIWWYTQLGFNRVYFLNTEPQNEAAIKKFITPALLNKVTFINHTCPTNQFSYLRNAFKTIMTEDYILHADSDEYFMLPKQYSNISDFVTKHNYDKYLFRWANIPVNSLYEVNMANYLLSNKATSRYCATHKMMVRREAWLADPHAKCNPHDFRCAGTSRIFQDPASTGKAPFYIHFLVRGYLHTGIKVLVQRLPTVRGKTPKETAVKFLVDKIPMKEYPFRYLSASGEYSICTKGYLRHLSQWRIPVWKPEQDRKEQTIDLYIQTLSEYGVNAERDLLDVDSFNLSEKISSCTEIVNEKYRKRLVGKMPSHIGIFLQAHL